MNAPANVYEAWVLGLRRWSEDPTADLGSLPALDETALPPAAYQRLIRHLNSAIATMMQRWQDAFARAFGSAYDDHTRARVLVGARAGLAARLELARHPSLPQVFRDELEKQAAADIRDLQSQLEDQANRLVAGAGQSNRPVREATLKMIRENALTAVLAPGYRASGPMDDAVLQRADAEAAAMSSPEGLPVLPPASAHTSTRPRRRVFSHDSED